MAERWFFALWPDQAAREALAAQLPGLVPARARATHPLDLHLTLVFLGELDPARLSCVERAAAQVRATSFELGLERVGHFARPRVLWCGPVSTPSSLGGLVAALEGQLHSCGIAPERRAYQPHMTLARQVSIAPAVDLGTPVRWRVSEFVLAAGQGGPPPRYAIRHRWPLA